MSSLVSTTSWQWPGDVLAFVAQHQIDGYLEPLLQATRSLFPQARSIQVFLESDPEIRDEEHIVIEVETALTDVPHFLEAKRNWNQELFRLCPAPLTCHFRLTLLRTEA